MADNTNRTGGLFSFGASMRKRFGFNLSKDDNRKGSKSSAEIDSDVSNDRRVSFTAPEPDDGGVVLSGGVYSGTLDIDQIAKNDIDMITKYREIAMSPELETAIDDIINEAIVYDNTDMPIKLDTSMAEDLEDGARDKINECFEKILRLYDVKNRIYEIFRRWYIDSRLFYNIIIDPDNPKEGILELRYVDPLFMQKITEIKTENSPQGVPLVTDKKEYYIFDNSNMYLNDNTSREGQPAINNIIDPSRNVVLLVNSNAVVYVPSGLYDIRNKRVIGYLHKAMRPLNQLKMVEDAIVIYRLSRAPERRVFYVDVGNLPKTRAEEYLQALMNKYKNKMVYDSSTGEIQDDKRFHSMIEDYWMPRREGGRGTEISTLPGGQNLGELEDVKYFQKKLYRALNIPFSRTEESSSLNASRSSEILRDELKFAKFVSRLRRKFSNIFLQALRIECILTGVVTEDEWEQIENDLNIYFINESSYKETKDLEVLNDRLEALDRIKPFIGKYYSHDWVRQNILRMNEDEIKEINKEIEKEKAKGEIQADEEIY